MGNVWVFDKYPDGHENLGRILHDTQGIAYYSDRFTPLGQGKYMINKRSSEIIILKEYDES